MRTILFAIAAAILAGSASAASAPAGEVYVLGALQRLHETEPGFSYVDLRRIIERLDPDVVVLEVRPDELAERKATQGRPEYPAVVWPWLATAKVEAVAMEPGGRDFERMTGEAGAAFAAFQTQKPRDAAYMASLGRTLTVVLQDHWRGPADAHDQVTADLVTAQALAEAQVGGPALAAGQAAWDGYMVERAKAAIHAHPGRRILVLASYRNLPAFRRGLADEPRVADMEAWLRSAFPAP